jgi:hypothetical protein
VDIFLFSQSLLLVSKNLAMKPGLTLWVRFNAGRRYPVKYNYAINLLSNNAISHFLTFLQVTGFSFAQSQPAIAIFRSVGPHTQQRWRRAARA